VSLVSQNLESENRVHGYVTACDVSKRAAGTGAWVGGIFGLLVGAAFVWVPGFGPLLVVGSLSAVLLGGLEGALTGAAGAGLLGGLLGWGISKRHVLKYEQAVKAGKYLVVAHGSADEVARARDLLRDTNADNVRVHAQAA
jgi:hypothetical protein